MPGPESEGTERSTGSGYGFGPAQITGLARSSTGVSAIGPDYESGTTPGRLRRERGVAGTLRHWRMTPDAYQPRAAGTRRLQLT
jgi:hypothetical protein